MPSWALEHLGRRNYPAATAIFWHGRFRPLVA
jgi:hypothetical protein